MSTRALSATTSGTMRRAVDSAVRASEKKRADVDSCPSCNHKAALLSLVFRGIRIGRLCRFCPFTSFVDFEPKPPAKAARVPEPPSLKVVK